MKLHRLLLPASRATHFFTCGILAAVALLWPLSNDEIFGNIDINDAGQIAFHYELASGQQGIAVATPVPEPSSILLVFLMLGSTVVARRLFPTNLASLRKLSLFRHAFVCWLAPAVFAGSWSATAKGAAYTFTNIADETGIYRRSTDILNGIGTAPLAINNSGVVAFTSSLDDGGTGVFTGSGGPIQNIALSSGPIFSVVVNASIKDNGTVAFRGILDSGVRGVFTSNGNQLTTVALNTEPTFSIFLGTAINNAGTVAFHVQFTDGSRAIFTRNGGTTTQIAAERDPIFRSVGPYVSLNSAGTVAFGALLENGQPGIFAGNGGAPITIALGGTDLRDGPSINDFGYVAFNDGSGINVGNGSQTMSITGGTGRSGNYAAINNRGEVAFIAGITDVGSGIFAGSGSIADEVIRTGDFLFGSPVTRFSLFPIPTDEIYGNLDINDDGQIAFHYELEGGFQGIAVATPVPEPGIVGSLAIGMFQLGSMRRRSLGV